MRADSHRRNFKHCDKDGGRGRVDERGSGSKTREIALFSMYGICSPWHYV